MIAVNIEKLYQAYDTFKRMYLRTGMALEDLEGIRRQLTHCEGMQTVVERLNQQAGALEEELAILGQMLQALQRITEIYARGENRVIGECEAEMIKRRSIAFGQTNLANMISNLYDVQFG